MTPVPNGFTLLKTGDLIGKGYFCLDSSGIWNDGFNTYTDDLWDERFVPMANPIKKAPQVISLNVVTRLQDNGDGGYTFHVYNNKEELIADHPLNCEGDLTDEKRAEILNGDYEYENGYIGEDTIEIVIDDNGDVKLSKKLHFHAGQ
jgi:hypothetical protein